MRAYIVGGAIRDQLLGLPLQDRDWVVVGATPEEMTTRGFVPVGRDFPVFLHPETHEEYALARTERKSGRGYRGFTVFAAPEVTLEQDLARRDLTINAAAAPPEWAPGDDGLIDPFGGQRDLRAGILRHVTDAFREDPVRILRVARFAARFPDFSVAAETLALMRDMVDAGEAQDLVAERVWQELSRGLMETEPQRMFEILRQCGALAVIFPELDRLWGVPQRADHHPEIDCGIHVMLVLQVAAHLRASLAVRWACLTHDLGKGTTPATLLPRHHGHEARSARMVRVVGKRLRVPADCTELAEVVAREHGNIHHSGGLSGAALVRLLARCDAWRKPGRFADALLACECDARGRLGHEQAPYPQRQHLLEALAATEEVDTSAVAQAAAAKGARGAAVGAAIARARARAVQARLGSAGGAVQSDGGP